MNYDSYSQTTGSGHKLLTLVLIFVCRITVYNGESITFKRNLFLKW